MFTKRTTKISFRPSVSPIIAAAAAAALAGALLVCCLAEMNEVRLLAEWNDSESYVDLDNEGSPEQITICDRQLEVRDQGGSLLFESKPGWHCHSFLTGDIDRDGSRELLVLVWKRGSFGEHRPFWISRDSDAYSQHIFIYKLRDGEIHPIWMSSELSPLVKSWHMNDNQTIHILTDHETDTDWGWLTWGLTRIK